MFGTSPPILKGVSRDNLGCWCGCAGIMFLMVFLPLAAGVAWSERNLWPILEVVVPVALIATAGGIGMLAVFSAVGTSRQVHDRKKFRRRLMKVEPMTDAEFCAAILDCEPQQLIEFRHLLGEYLGIPPTLLRPDENLRLSSGEEVGGLVYCVEQATRQRFDVVCSLLGDDFWTLDEDSPQTVLYQCAYEARIYCRIMTAYHSTGETRTNSE